MNLLKIKSWLHRNKGAQFEILQEDQEGIYSVRRFGDGRIFERGKGYELGAAAGFTSRILTFTEFHYDLIHVKYKFTLFFNQSIWPGKESISKINEITHNIESYPSPIPEDEWLGYWEEDEH